MGICDDCGEDNDEDPPYGCVCDVEEREEEIVKDFPELPQIEMPDRIARLPRLGQYPVPFFVGEVDGVPDFRVIRPRAIEDCVLGQLCWLCGQKLGAYKAFVLGPMCGITRTSAEPPSHKDCALYAALVCPFLANPERARREDNLPEHKEMPGIGLKRNPGVTLIWITKTYTLFRTESGPGGARAGILFRMGHPEERLWFARGRTATAAEVSESIRTGLPSLKKLAEEQGPGAIDALERMEAALTAALDKETAHG